jgi:heparan-alpha-glucosaminide N-acetyltransferase
MKSTAMVDASASASVAGEKGKIPASSRVTSIDALRGFVMFTMIYVNDIAGAPQRLIPDWMVHFSDRHDHGSGMTFVDLVFPGFLFVMGMSIPFAFEARLSKGEPLWKIILHAVARTLSLLAIGILMVNGESGGTALWHYLMFLSAIFAFCSISSRGTGALAKFWKGFGFGLRLLGFAGMIYCAFSFRGDNGERVIEFSPFSIHTSWYGILGLIGWAYLTAMVVFLVFRTRRTALLGCVALLFCFYPADREGAFSNFWIENHIVSMADTLGSHGAIATAGVLLAAMLLAPEYRERSRRLNFTLLFIAGCSVAALLLNSLYGISKNDATPSWCLWSCAVTAALWLGFDYLERSPARLIAGPFRIAGQNVLLAYLLSEMLPNPLHWVRFSETGLWSEVACSLVWAGVVLAMSAGLNRVGFRLRI